MRILPTLLVLCAVSATARADWLSTIINTSATAPKAAGVPAALTGQPMKSARVRWLDKQTNRVTPLTLQAGTTQTPNGMKLVMTNCLADYAGVPGQDVAWLEVREDKRDAPWFAGWMFNNYPEIATLDHPRFDLELVGCGDQPRAKLAVPVAPMQKDEIKPGVKDTESPQDTESGAGAEAPATPGADPYYVPGVENPSIEKAAPEGATPANAPTPAPAGNTAPEATMTPPELPVQQPSEVPEGERVEPLPGSVPTAPPADDNGALKQMMDGGQY